MKTLTELEAEKKTSAQLQQQLAGLQKNLDQEAVRRKAAEQQAAELQSRLDGLEKEKGQLNSELTNVRSQITDLEQQSASGRSSAQEEIAATETGSDLRRTPPASRKSVNSCVRTVQITAVSIKNEPPRRKRSNG
jgi:chromosome segregation ATPase